MLVFVGGQGIGKSTFLYNLLKPLNDYVVSTVVNPLDKDSIINLAENILVIINELDGINKHKEAELKELITLQSIKVRRPYGRFATTMTRRASFASSTNMEQLLSDVSGSRRFLIHSVTSIDYRTPIDWELFWAQVYGLYASRYRFWFEGEEIKQINQHNIRYRHVSGVEEMLLLHYEPGKQGGGNSQEYTASELLTDMQSQG